MQLSFVEYLCVLSSIVWTNWGKTSSSFVFHITRKLCFSAPGSLSKTKGSVFDIWPGISAQLPNCFPYLCIIIAKVIWLFSKVDDLAVGRCVHFPTPPPAASKAVAYQSTMPTNRPGTAVLDDLSLYGLKGWCCSFTAQWEKVETKNLKVELKVCVRQRCVSDCLCLYPHGQCKAG